MPEACERDQYVIHGPPVLEIKETRQVGQLLIDKMKEHGDKIAHINADTDYSETFSTFRLRCLRAASRLQELGAGPDRPVCVCAGNHEDVFATAVASLLCGATVSVLDPALSTDDIGSMLKNMRPGLIFSAKSSAKIVAQVAEALGLDANLIVYAEQYPGYKSFREFQKETGIEEQFQAHKFPDLKKAVALVLCSSGSTGLPKGVEVSHYALIKKMALPSLFEENLERYFSNSTLYWITGCFLLYEGLCNGFTRIFATEIYTEEKTCQIIEKYKINYMFTAPVNLNSFMNFPSLTKYDLSSLKLVAVSGAMIDFQIVHAFQKEMLKNAKFYALYGMTEVGLVSGKYIEEPALESTGAIREGVSVKIVDPTTNKTLPFGQVGEVCIKTDSMMIGYRNNPEATRNTIDTESWLHSGDAGYLDDNGYLYITDRYKELIEYADWPICPAEIEAVLRSHSSVLECCVVGIPNGRIGNLLLAFVQTKANRNVTEKQLKDLVADRLADQKRLRGGVRFVQQIPLLPSGKIDRKSMKRQSLELAEEVKQNADI